ncbi:MAG TPA: amidohydrolase family protein, partial [Chloroflexota bacterium]
MGDVRYGAMPYPGRWRVANGRIVDPSQGIDEVGDLLIEGSRIVGVAKPGEAGGPCFDASGLVVCPGFVDIHCHLREPGQEHKETIATGSRAAAAGGFTTICCMPNTRPVLDNAGQIEFVLETAARDALV